MLSSLEIKNFRNLKSLKIDSLGRVNLITGKNNTGKSTILEAIAILAAKGKLNLLFQLLADRGDISRQSIASGKDATETNLKALSSLFTDRVISFDDRDVISIKGDEANYSDIASVSQKSLSLRFVRFIDEIEKNNVTGAITRRQIPLSNDLETTFDNLNVGLEIKFGDRSNIIPLNKERISRFPELEIGTQEAFQIINSRNLDKKTNGKLFDNIALSEKEQSVIDALKIIEPTTERIAFVEESISGDRSARIKLSKHQGVLPLRSMGDGINRILNVILALVNVDNGFLLIDEFENGLHHTVQEQLWNIIFSLAEKLNIQVFVTTHSEDCISGFENTLNSSNNSVNGKLIRLDNENGIIKQVEFDADELKIANEHNIEIR